MIRTVQKYRPTRSVFEIELQLRHVSIVVDQIYETIEKGIASVNNFQVKNDRETLALLTVTDSFADDLQVAVFGLARISIKAYKNGQHNVNVGTIAKNISNLIYSIQKSCSTDPETLKKKLKSGLDGAKDETHQLYQLLQNEALRSNIVSVIENVLFAVRKLHYRLIFETKILQEMEDVELTVDNRFAIIVKNITKEDDAIIKNFLRATQQGTPKMHQIIRMLNQEADGYDDKTRLELTQTAYRLNEVMAFVNVGLRTLNELGAMKEHGAICGRGIYIEMVELLNVLDPKNSNGKTDLNLRNLILLVIAQHCAVEEAVTDGFEHIGQN